jgi:hypothetical protein
VKIAGTIRRTKVILMSRQGLPSSGAVPSEDVLRRMRVPLIRRAALLFSDRPSEETFVIDLALSGLFVERANPLPMGDEVDVRFFLPDNETPIVAGCRVAWWLRVAWWHPPATMLDFKDLPAGLGLSFVRIAPEDQQRVREYLSEYYQRDHKVRSFVRHDSGTEGETT